MTYSDEALARLREQFSELPRQVDDLQVRYFAHDFRSRDAREYALHGFLRRIQTLRRCVQNAFSILPPEHAEIPDRDTRKDAEISIHAFVLGAFGALDNLAWLWIKEIELRRPNGQQLSKFEVGLRSDKRVVRASFSQAFQDRLNELEDWFTHLTGFRDSLAHRVPLYIPPYIVTGPNQAEYLRLKHLIDLARARLDLEQAELFEQQQMRLVKFRAWMQRSQNEEPRPVPFHAQLLNDFLTLREIGEGVLSELQGRVAENAN